MVVIGNGVVFLLSLFLFWDSLPEVKAPFELSLYRDQIMAALVGLSGVLFGVSVWRATIARRTSRAARTFAVELESERSARADLEGKFQQQAVQMATLEQAAAAQEEVVRRAAEYRSENEELRKALKQAEVRRQEPSTASQDGRGRELMHVLSRLQEKGRFVDFVMEDIAGYSDQQVGTAARFVHDGCRAVVREYLDLAPVQSGSEGAAVTLSEPRSSVEVQFLGRSPQAFPATGRLVHRGWRVVKSRLPHITSGHAETDAPGDILAPAQVELA